MNQKESTPKYSFFSHKECEYFPCHNAVPEEEFNCLFCYCPLYTLGTQCGGNFHYTEKGVKNCKNCAIPHGKNGYSYIVSKFQALADLAKE